MVTYHKLETEFLQLVICTDEEYDEISLMDDDERNMILGFRLSEDPEGKLLRMIAWRMDECAQYHYHRGFSEGRKEGARDKQREVAYTIRHLIELPE